MLDQLQKNPILILVVLLVAVMMFKGGVGLKEGWGTSPATMIQLSSSSGYYPYWRYGFGYRYPYYRHRYPFHSSYPMAGHYPLPYGNYKYGLY